MKKLVFVLLCLVLLGGCTKSEVPAQKQYTATFLTLFDTVTTIIGKADSEQAFQQAVQPFYDELEYYHRLFDIYHEYEGLHNLKTLNDRAAIEPVKVTAELLEFLSDCKDYWRVTNGTFNPAMGSVLCLWHDARKDGINDPENAYLPELAALEKAALHTNPEDILLNFENSTVFFTDPDLKLDVGGVAKGWAVQRVFEDATEGFLVSAGGNVYAAGPKDKNGTPWAVGIQDPTDSSKFLHVLNITHGSVVTSGSYHRAYAVDGRLYHHIIDPETLYPGERWTSVTIVCEDSGLADVLSTALFLLDRKDGQALLEKYDAQALWVDAIGNQYYSSGFRSFLRNELR